MEKDRKIEVYIWAERQRKRRGRQKDRQTKTKQGLRYKVGCQGVLLLGRLVLGCPQQVSLRLRLVNLVYSLKVPSEFEIRAVKPQYRKKMLLEKVDTLDKAMAVLLSEEQANIDSKQCSKHIKSFQQQSATVNFLHYRTIKAFCEM